MFDPWTLLIVLLFVSSRRSESAPDGAARLMPRMGMTVFPVTQDAASFSADYAPPKHMGVDIFAASGTAVVAPEAGSVRFTTDPLGGSVFYLAGKSGTTYYGAHLMGFMGKDRKVKAGEHIAWVGATGNAAGGSPHLHFQINGGKTDPYPLLKSLHPTAPPAPWAKKEAVA